MTWHLKYHRESAYTLCGASVDGTPTVAIRSPCKPVADYCPECCAEQELEEIAQDLEAVGRFY